MELQQQKMLKNGPKAKETMPIQIKMEAKIKRKETVV